MFQLFSKFEIIAKLFFFNESQASRWGGREDNYFLVINCDPSKPESIEMIYPIDKEKTQAIYQSSLIDSVGVSGKERVIPQGH